MNLAPSALLSMLIVRLACIMIFCALDYRSVSIFYHPSRYDAKNFFFYVFEAKQFTDHFAPFDVFNSLGFNSYGTQFPYFWIIPMAFKHLKIVDRSTFNDSASSSCDWLESWSSKTSTSSPLTLAGLDISCLPCQNDLFYSDETSTHMSKSIEYNHYKLPIAFVDFQ